MRTVRTCAPPSARATRVSNAFDLVVVGGGIIGAFAAYLAAERRPRWRVLVVDRSFLAGGATRYSAGLDMAYADTPLRATLVAESLPVYEALCADGVGLPIREHVLWCVVTRSRYDEQREHFVGPAPRAATASDVAALQQAHPDLRIDAAEAVVGGLPCRVGDAAGTAMALLERAVGDHLSLWEGVEVSDVQAEEGGVLLTLADRRVIHSAHVILAPGPWALAGPGAGLARGAGVRVKKVVGLHVERPAAPGDAVIWFPEEDAFLMPLPPGRWLFSFASQEWDCRPEPSVLNISSRDRELALSILARHCPAATDCCPGGRVFCDAYGPGRDPVVTADGNVPGVVFAGAGSGSGFRLAPAIARRALDLVEAAAGE